MDWAKIIDCGDAPLTFLDNTVALKQLQKAHEVRSVLDGSSLKERYWPVHLNEGRLCSDWSPSR